MDVHYGSFKNQEQKLETPALFLVYDLPLAALPWMELKGGDVLHFFFEENGINIAHVSDGNLDIGFCYNESTKGYAAFRAGLTCHGKLNIVVLFKDGGCALVVGQGVNGRYRVIRHEKLTAERLGAMKNLIKETNATA